MKGEFIAKNKRALAARSDVGLSVLSCDKSTTLPVLTSFNSHRYNKAAQFQANYLYHGIGQVKECRRAWQ